MEIRHVSKDSVLKESERYVQSAETDSSDPAVARPLVLVNLGCGARFHPAWINYDLHASSPIVTACDLTQGIPLRDSVADAVYSAAVFEHLRPFDIDGFLSECQRVLKPGGILRIAVPDFECQAKEYLAAIRRIDEGCKDAEFDRSWMLIEIVDQFSREVSGGELANYLASPSLSNKEFVIGRIGGEGRELIESLQKVPMDTGSLRRPNLPYVRGRGLGRRLLRWLLGSSDLDSDLRALSIGRFRMSGEVHRWAYDRYSLTKILAGAGFSAIQVCHHGESRIPSWQGFFLEVDQHGQVCKPDLLIAECIKNNV